MKIRFTKDAQYSDLLVPIMYSAGEIHDLRDDLAERWIRRGVAEAYAPPPEIEAVPAPAQDPAPDPAPVKPGKASKGK